MHEGYSSRFSHLSHSLALKRQHYFDVQNKYQCAVGSSELLLNVPK